MQIDPNYRSYSRFSENEKQTHNIIVYDEDNEYTFQDWYLIGSDNVTRLYPWQKGEPVHGIETVKQWIKQGYPLQSDKNSEAINASILLFDADDKLWQLAKLYFCSKKDKSSLLGVLPLEVFKEICFIVYPPKKIETFSRIVSDIHKFVLFTHLHENETGYYIMDTLKNSLIDNKLKHVLAKNVSLLCEQSGFCNYVCNHFNLDIAMCLGEGLLHEDKNSGEYKYVPQTPELIDDDTQIKKKQKTQ